MMQQITQLKRYNPKFCRQRLATVSTAFRPLHLAELGLLSGLPRSISNHMENMKQIAKMCGSFLTIREDTVFIVHQSANDFFNRENI
jgi:hypothetical protein